MRLLHSAVFCGGLCCHLRRLRLPCICRRSIGPIRWAWMSRRRALHGRAMRTLPTGCNRRMRFGSEQMSRRSAAARETSGTRVAWHRPDSIDIAYRGPALHSQTRYYWTVRVWDNKGKEEESAPAWFETGLRSPSDWSAQWIRRDDPADASELQKVRWLWLPNADAQHVAPNTVVAFRYVLHLDAAPCARVCMWFRVAHLSRL